MWNVISSNDVLTTVGNSLSPFQKQYFKYLTCSALQQYTELSTGHTFDRPTQSYNKNCPVFHNTVNAPELCWSG